MYLFSGLSAFNVTLSTSEYFFFSPVYVCGQFMVENTFSHAHPYMFSTEVCAFSETHPNSSRWLVCLPRSLGLHVMNGKRPPPAFPFLHILGERNKKGLHRNLVIPVNFDLETQKYSHYYCEYLKAACGRRNAI